MNVLIVDDKQNIRMILKEILEASGYKVTDASNAKKALELVSTDSPDIVLTDLKMDGMDGIELTKKIKEIDPDIPVILITAYGSISSAVEAIKSGGYDYLTKPIDYDLLKIKVMRALDEKKRKIENKVLKRNLEEKWSMDTITGKSQPMLRLFSLIKTVAPTESSVLIEGECGTGKELIARSIFINSKRNKNPFVVVDCSVIPAGILESELFGYEKGAFTGAETRKRGRIETANTGTLFLDEIGELSPELQAKLLRVIQEKQIVRVGGLAHIDVDFRLIAATNKNLREEVDAGRFRSDLYYRLNVIKIKAPPLRERREDIPLLASEFVSKFAEKNRIKEKTIPPSLMSVFISYDWPGNVRELENCIERLMVVSPGDALSALFLPEEMLHGKAENSGKPDWCGENAGEFPAGKDMGMADAEKRLIIRALADAEGNKAKAARILKIDRKALYNRLKKFNLDVPNGTHGN